MEDMKRCPKCGQMIKREALKCRFCGYWFTAGDSGPAYTQPNTGPYTSQQQSSNQQSQQSYQQQNYQQSQQNYQQENYQQSRWQGQGQDNRYQESYSTPMSDNGGRVITVSGLLQEGFAIGIKNFLSIFVAYILYFLTIWIPYLNVGTTIGMSTLPLKLSKNANAVISPTFIFDGKYRKYMGEFFNLIGLMFISLLPAWLFVFVPAIIISYGWSQALYLLLDKEVSPSDAMMQSTKITYGYKSTLFWTDLAIYAIMFVIILILSFLINLITNSMVVNMIINIIVVSVFSVVKVGCSAVAYRELSKREV